MAMHTAHPPPYYAWRESAAGSAVTRRITSLLPQVALMGLALFALAGCTSSRRAPSLAMGQAEAAPALADGRVGFEEEAGRAGLRFTQVNGAAGDRYFPECMCGGAGVIDYNGDGRPDLYLVNGAPMPGFKGDPHPSSALYRNNGDGTFTDVTAKSGLAKTFYGMGCAVGDYDNDGHDDLYVTAVLSPARLFHNNGDGTFSDRTTAAGVGDYGYWGASCAWVDYDRDGKLDLFVTNYVLYRTLKDHIPCIYRPGIVSYCTPRTYQGESCVLYRNLGNGRFQDVTRKAGVYNPQGKSLGITIWDVGNDGWPDIFVSNDGAPNFLYRNDHHGGFKEVGAEAGISYADSGDIRAGMGIDTADEFGNGKTSMLVTDFSAEMVGLYRQTRGLLFQDDAINAGIGQVTLMTLGFGTFFFDADNDGNFDVLVVNGHVQDDIALFQQKIEWAQKPWLFVGDGMGKYTEVASQVGGPLAKKMVARGAAWLDYDGDGRQDVLVVDNNRPVCLWHNTSRAPNHWLEFRLRGRKSNRDGNGARVTLMAGGKRQTRMVRNGSSYLVSNQLIAHFGLGAAQQADSVEVRWPSGRTQTLGPTRADRLVTVTEDE